MPKKRALKTSKRTVLKPHKRRPPVIFGVINWSVRKEVNVGRSLAADRRKKAKTKVAKGQGDRGETWRKPSGSAHGSRWARDR